MTLAIFDLDGTILPIPEATWNPENFTWDNFLSVMDNQEAFGSVLGTLQWHLHMGHTVVVVTARPEHERQRTINLLDKVGFTFNELIMRPTLLVEAETLQVGAAESQEEVKGIVFNNHANWRKGVRELFINRGDSMSYAYDDQMANLMIWREVGCSVWLVDGNGHLNGVNGSGK